MFKRASIPFRFILLAVVLLALWIFGYEGYLKQTGQPDYFITTITASAGSLLLNLIGYPVTAYPVADGAALWMENTPVLGIARNCNGLAMFALFSGFILIFPGNNLKKLFFIPAGLFVLFVLNVIRVAFLAVIQLHYPSWLEFNHKYTFTVIIYALVFLLWMLWVNRFATKPSHKALEA